MESTTRKKPLYNSCNHTKLQAHNYAYQAVYPYTNPASCGYRDYFRIPLRAGLTAPKVKAPDWAEYADAQRRAWWSMQPRYEAEISILNFIYEMKDFKTIAKRLMKFEVSKIGSKLVSLKKQLRKSMMNNKSPATVGDTLSTITKTSAEARLVYSFAVMPLIADITAILKTLAITVQEAQARFALQGTLESDSHYSESLPIHKDGSYGTTDNTKFIWYGSSSSSLFTATMQYKYRYKMREGWDLFKRGWGLEVNAEVIWNAIPFSFLVDYFYKVGQAIHNMSTDPNVFLKVHQYCESILVTSTNGTLIDPGRLAYFYAPTANLWSNGMVAMNGITGTHYQRRLVAPNKGMATPKAKLPSNGQLLNMAALARCFFS